MGVNTGKYKMQIFILSSMFAGLAGWLFAHMSYSISPSSFTLNTSIIFLTMIVLGGSGSVWGAIFGTILIKIVGIIIHILSEQFPIITSDFEHVIYGLILMLVIIFLPRGLFPAAVDWIQSLQLKKWEKKVQQKEVYPD
jgi:branched-chain amino acid transport system permease protein